VVENSLQIEFRNIKKFAKKIPNPREINIKNNMNKDKN